MMIEFYVDVIVGEFWIGLCLFFVGVVVDFDIVIVYLDGFCFVEGELVFDVDDVFMCFVLELCLIKDEFEIVEMCCVVDIIVQGFDDIICELFVVVVYVCGECVVEGVFYWCVCEDGNGEGYDMIVVFGFYVCYLYWICNDGMVVLGDLIFVDVGVEVDSLYMVDIICMFLVLGFFMDVQCCVYEIVCEVVDVVFEVVRVGVCFCDVYVVVMKVIVEWIVEWGFFLVFVEEVFDVDKGGQYCCYMVYGMLYYFGIDVYDCVQVCREMYYDGIFMFGMVFMIELGFYFQIDDFIVFVELCGIGVCIEDDILMMEDGFVNLFVGILCIVDEVEVWIVCLYV